MKYEAVRMKSHSKYILVVVIAALAILSSCGGGVKPAALDSNAPPEQLGARKGGNQDPGPGNKTVWDYFNQPNTENSVSVNKYIWSASLEVLNFLPVQSVDPFTGIIVTGFGTPPGGGRSYRATVLIDDPALDARALTVALHTSGGGTADPATVRAIENAILSRARQLRIADGKL